MDIQALTFCPSCGSRVVAREVENATVYLSRDWNDGIEAALRVIRDYALVAPVFSKDVERDLKDLMED